MGTLRRRQILQPSEQRILQRDTNLPSNPRFYGPIRPKRRSLHQSGLEVAIHRGRPFSGVQRPWPRCVRHERGTFPDDAGIHQLW